MASAYTLEFEKPLLELERQIEDLKRIGTRAADRHGRRARGPPGQARIAPGARSTGISRRSSASWSPAIPAAPTPSTTSARIFTDFIELHGDRLYMDDPAIVGGWARLGGISVMVIGHQKGRDTQGEPQAQLRHAAPGGIPEGAPPDEARRQVRRAGHHADRHAGRLPRARRRGARAVRGPGAEHPRDVGAADARRRRGDRRGRLGRRARARRGRPHPHAGELGLLGDLARGMRRDSVEGRQPARARGRGAQDHGGGPPAAQGDRRDRRRSRWAARTSIPTPPARRSARR